MPRRGQATPETHPWKVRNMSLTPKKKRPSIAAATGGDRKKTAIAEPSWRCPSCGFIDCGGECAGGDF